MKEEKRKLRYDMFKVKEANNDKFKRIKLTSEE
jgi:hypothetical protein